MLFLQPVVVNDAAQRPVAAEVRVAERPAQPPEWTGPMLAQAPSDQRSPFGTGAPDKNDVTPSPVLVPPPNPSSDEPTPADPMNKKIPPAPNRPDAGPPPPTGKFDTHTDMVGPLAQGTVPDTTTNVPNTIAPGAPTPGTTAVPGTTATPGLPATPGTTPGMVATPGTPPSTTPPGITTPAPLTPGTGGTSGMAPEQTTTPGLGGASGTSTVPGGAPPATVPGAVAPPAQPTGVPDSNSSSTFPGAGTPTFPGASSGASNTR